MPVVDYIAVLRALSINDPRFATGRDQPGEASGELDPRTVALLQLAALVAVGGAVPSYGSHADAALSAGATATEIVDVLVAILPVVGRPCVVEAAPKLALALGYDTDDPLEQSEP